MTFFVQSTGQEFILRLFEVKPPVVETESDETEPLSVDARCVGQFVMSHGRARELLNLLQKYVEPSSATLSHAQDPS